MLAATEPTVVNPVTMTFGPDGRLYVVEWKEGRGPNDRILALTDADGDGLVTDDEVAPITEGGWSTDWYRHEENFRDGVLPAEASAAREDHVGGQGPSKELAQQRPRAVPDLFRHQSHS